MENKLLVYGLIDPFSQEIRYVGKSVTGLSRPRCHWNQSELKYKTRKSAWVKSVLSTGAVPEILVLETCTTHEDLVEAEIHWIGILRMIGANLTNATRGGDGCWGRVLSPETRRQIGQSQKGKTISAQTRARISEARGITPDLEARILASFSESGITKTYRALGVSKRTVYLIARRHGLSTRQERPRLAQKIKTARNLRSQGILLHQIAREFGVTESTISRWCKDK